MGVTHDEMIAFCDRWIESAKQITLSQYVNKEQRTQCARDIVVLTEIKTVIAKDA